MVQHCERMAGSVRVGQASNDAPSSRFQLPAASIAERGFCVDADDLRRGEYLAAQFMQCIAHRFPQIIESPRKGGAFALINAALSRDGISYEQRVVAESERLVQTAETTASYSRT